MQLVAELLFRLLQVQHQQRLVNALVANTGTLLGFGFSQPGIALTGGTSITLALGVGDYAFVAPRAGTITSLAGFFSATAKIISIITCSSANTNINCTCKQAIRLQYKVHLYY